MHRFLYIILSKNHTVRDRRNINVGEIWTQIDFAERLTLKFNKESQLEHFGGGRTVSLEGVAVEYFQWVSQSRQWNSILIFLMGNNKTLL